MRALAFFSLLLGPVLMDAQDRILLNEVLPGNQGITTDSAGRTPDWIELYNATAKAIDLNGWRIATAGRQHAFTAPLVVPARSYRVLWCDGRVQEGADHIAFKLEREGGAILLIAPDGVTISDVFSYPAVPGDVSIGRYPDGASSWSFFVTPTPGTPNYSSDGAIREQCTMPVPDRATGRYEAPFALQLSAEEGARILYTLDGSRPSLGHGALYDRAIPIVTNATVRAVAVRDGHLMSAPMTATYILGPPVGQAIALSLAHADLWDDSTGIYTVGAFNNNTRTGKAWQREGVVQWFDGTPIEVDVRISGSGSRGSGKRSFKVIARNGPVFAFDDSTRGDEVFLRADAGPHAWLRNTLLEELVRRYGLNVEVQPSRTAALYLNGAYWGLYRWMPGKDAGWLRQRTRAEALDVLEGPAALVLSGSDERYRNAQALLLRGASADSLAAMIDLESLIDLACIDLWTGRADHDLNVRCYRPREQGGRWRWVLFDMDLWAPATENSVERMCSAVVPETPFVPQLLSHPELQEQTLARMCALQAAVFANAGIMADELHRAHAEALTANFRRWELELDMPPPDHTLAQIHDFTVARPDHLFAHLAQRTQRKVREVTIEVPQEQEGEVFIGGLRLSPGRHRVPCFTDVRVVLEARAAHGHEFAGWKGVDARAARAVVDLSRAKNVRVAFRALLP